MRTRGLEHCGSLPNFHDSKRLSVSNIFKLNTKYILGTQHPGRQSTSRCFRFQADQTSETLLRSLMAVKRKLSLRARTRYHAVALLTTRLLIRTPSTRRTLTSLTVLYKQNWERLQCPKVCRHINYCTLQSRNSN